MAQNKWVNVTVDGQMSSKVDIADHKHGVSRGASASGDATFSFDTAKITSRTQARSVMNQILAQLGELPL